MKIFVTGGLGYIGSHSCVELLNSGHDVVIFDNLENSQIATLEKIAKITEKKASFEKGDIRDFIYLKDVLEKHQCDCVIHFAGLKSVQQSMQDPLIYYDYNVHGSITLLKAMQAVNLKKIIFSSSATVYGTPHYLPYDENHPRNPENIYGKTKFTVENILQDLSYADPDWQVSILRYFNPVGAHKTGLIGEDPKGTPNNLLPLIAQVASNLREELIIYGNDYETQDGTAIRDYIHVVDLALGHLCALKALEHGVKIYNLGCGKGETVLNVLQCFENVSKTKIPYRIGDRRAGDLAAFYASTEKANKELNWHAKYNLKEMCADMWRFQCYKQQKNKPL